MFEINLYEYVETGFPLSNVSDPLVDFSGIVVGFGGVPEATTAPYVVMYVLDSNGDPVTLCDSQYDSGNSFVQFNVVANSTEKAFYIKQKLGEFLTQTRYLTGGTVSYTIDRTTHGASPSAQTLTNGLAVDVLAKTFNYTKVI